MCWDNKKGKHCGLVCATHDRMLGRTNLVKSGMTLKDAMLFEKYCRTVPDLQGQPDFDEWLQNEQKRVQ